MATGRSAAEYLKEGQLYETVLRKLFAAIDPRDACDIYLQCLNTLLQATSRSASNIYITGSWARIVILGQRIADKQSFSDIDDDLVKKTVSSISESLGTLCPTSDPYLTTVLICLSRRLLIPYASFNEEKGQLNKFRDHREWFRQFISRRGRHVVEALIQPLSQLLSLEPLELLRLNHRVFSVRRDLARIVSDYLIKARTRISDLDPASRNFLSEEEATSANVTDEDLKDLPKLVSSSARFIIDFASTKQLPGALLRQINFHRYHFQKSTKVALLSPMLTEYVAKSGESHFIPWQNSFEVHQIKLIKELAFKRKDKAVSVSEANEAIKAIQDARNARRRAEEREEIKTDAHNIGTDSRFEDAIDAVLGMPLKQIQMEKNASRREKSTQSPLQVLKHKVTKALSESSHADRVNLASQMLHGFCSALSSRTPHDTQIPSKTEPSQIPYILKAYEKWWSSTGFVLRYVIVEVLGDPSIQRLQRLFQYQLFAIICGRSGYVRPPMVGAMASLVVVILTLHADPSLADLCFTFTNSPTKMRHVMNVIIECLPFNSGCRVRNSIKFILHCVLLLHSAGETVSEAILKSNPEADSRDSQGSFRNLQSIFKARLRSLLDFLRWTLCNPWRLMEERIDMKSGISLNARAHASTVILNQIATVLLLLEHQEKGLLNIKRFLNIELRCGWGHEEEVHTFLENLECSGTSHRTILNDVLHFLATDENVLAMPHEWIQNAIVRFARDRAWCQRHMNGTSSRVAPVVEQLGEEFGTCNIQRGRKLFDFLILTDQCLFHGLSTPDAMRCIMRELNPKFWPFPRRYVRFIVRKLGAKCMKPLTLNYGPIHTQLLASNIAAEYLDDNRHGVLDGLSMDIKETLNRSLVSEVNDVAEVLQILEHEYEENSDIIEGSKRNLFASLVETHSCCIGSTLILCLCKDEAVNKRHVRKQRLKHHTALLCSTVSPLIACEVIDSALSTAAVVPFCSPFSTRRSHKLKLHQTTEWMKVLLSDRMGLTDSPDSVSAYIGVEYEHKSKDGDLIIRTLGQWLGRIGTEYHGSNSLPIAVCMGRILGTFRFVHEEILTRAVKRVGRNKTRALVANALRTYVSLLPQSGHLDERLPTECTERLVESRLQVQQDLLHSVVQIMQALRAIDQKGFEDLLANMLHRFEDIQDEINSFFQLRKIVC